MASKRDERREDTNPSQTSGAAAGQRQQQQQQQAATRAIEETKDNIKRAVEEARREIPRYTQTVNDYQHQTIDAAREITDNYLESQKEVISSLQTGTVPYFQNVYWWTSPQAAADVYTTVVRTMADNTIAATKFVNNMMFANMEATRMAMNYARDNAREMSRVTSNTAKAVQQSFDTMRNQWSSNSENWAESQSRRL